MPLAGCFTFLSCFCGFAILRSREPPDCGSFGNALIVCYLFLHSGTLYQFQSCVIFLAGDRSILFLRRPDHFQQVLISSPACALIRFYVTILISMPIGHWVRTIFGLAAGIARILFSFADASFQGSFMSRTLLSCCLDPLSSSVTFSRKEFHEDSFPKGAVPLLR